MYVGMDGDLSKNLFVQPLLSQPQGHVGAAGKEGKQGMKGAKVTGLTGCVR